MPESVSSYFSTDLPGKFTADASIAKAVNAILEFQIGGASGGTWTVDCTAEGAGKVTEGSAGNAKTTIVCADGDFLNILNKKTNAQMAFMSGKLKVKGDMTLALKLQKIL
jgi:putative sterol carrier protein